MDVSVHDSRFMSASDILWHLWLTYPDVRCCPLSWLIVSVYVYDELSALQKDALNVQTRSDDILKTRLCPSLNFRPICVDLFYRGLGLFSHEWSVEENLIYFYRSKSLSNITMWGNAAVLQYHSGCDIYRRDAILYECDIADADGCNVEGAWRSHAYQTAL